MVNLARGFVARGFMVDLVLAKAEGPYLADVPGEVRVIDLGASRVLASLPSLVKYLRRERPTAMLSALNHANIIALWAKRLSKIPLHLVISEHNTLSISNRNVRNTRSRLIPYLIKKNYPYADVVVAVSAGVKNDLFWTTGIAKEKIRVIYNPVVTPELFTKAEEHLDNPWFVPSAPPVIMGLGRLTAQKDFALLIRSFAQVRKSCPARLMILGEGEERPKLEALVQDLGLQADVALPGFMENPYKYLRRAAIFVLSSRWEGLPTVLIEALAVGTRVVATDCPSGPAEILADRWGRLVPVSDADALAKAITATLNDPTPPRTVWPVKDFDMDVAVEKYLAALGLVLQ